MADRTFRVKARELAFKLVFEDIFGSSTADELLGGLFEDEQNLQAVLEKEIDYIDFIRKNVKEHAEELDRIISDFSKGWTVERMNKVDIAILRLAICEILYREDVTNGVAINEAVELAKRYSTDEGPAFINGILGAYIRSL